MTPSIARPMPYPQDVVRAPLTIYYGAEKARWNPSRRVAIEQRLNLVVVIPFDLDLCRVYATTRASLPRGRTVAPNDLWIAACAIRPGIPLATNNRRHFENIPNLTLLPDPASNATLF